MRYGWCLTLPNVVNIDIENKNVVSTFSNVFQINVEIGNIDSKLFNAIKFNVDVHNIAPTFIWGCTTSWRHIILKTTLKQRWSVCWGMSLFQVKISTGRSLRWIIFWGDFFLWVFFLGGYIPGGFFPWGYFSGRFFPGGFFPRTVIVIPSVP